MSNRQSNSDKSISGSSSDKHIQSRINKSSNSGSSSSSSSSSQSEIPKSETVKRQVDCNWDNQIENSLSNWVYHSFDFNAWKCVN